MKSQIVSVIAVCLLAASGISAFGQERNVQIYKDSNGYFAAVPPRGWKTQGFPSETIRSKIRFDHSDLNGVYIGVIAAPTPRRSYSLGDLLAENRGKAETVKRIAPGATFTVAKERVGGREAVVQKIERGGSGLKSVTFIKEGMFYQVTLSTNSKAAERDSLSDTFQKFLNSFTILERGRKFSDAEMRAAVVAKYRRIAKIYEQDGDVPRALAWTKQGLEVDPNDKELLDIRSRLPKKQD